MRPSVLPILRFGLACFYFLSIDIVMDQVWPPQEIYMKITACFKILLCAGILGFAVCHRLVPDETKRTAVYASVCAVSAVSLLAFFYVPDPMRPYAYMCTALTAGFVCGWALYRLAADTAGSPYRGRAVGVAASVQALLQVLIGQLQTLHGALFVAAALVLVLWLTICQKPAAFPPARALHEPALPHVSRKFLGVLVCIVAVIALMGGLNDGILLLAHTRADVDLYTFPRVFHLAGLLLAGFLADYRKGRYLPSVILLLMSLAVIGVLFLGNEITLNINACIYFLFAGFCAIYFVVAFLDVAPRTKRPALWTGMGRACFFFCMGLGNLITDVFLTNQSFFLMIGVYCLLSVVLAVLFYVSGTLVPAKAARAGAAESPSPRSFIARYGLTDREAETLEKILASDQSAKELAQALFISERMVYRHLNSIYEKTGTSSRVGLLLLYYDRFTARKTP
jgi:DNA-binding CsgD family transcriptional regulator